MMTRHLLILAFLLAGCHISSDRPVVESAAPSTHVNDAATSELREKIIVQRSAGTVTESVCYQYALDAGNKGINNLDVVLREYYSYRGIDLSSDPIKIALRLHYNDKGTVIMKSYIYDDRVIYDINVGAGTLSGGEWRLTMAKRSGLYIPISDQVIAIY